MTSLSSVHAWTKNFKIHKYSETGTRHFNHIEMFAVGWPSGRKETEMRASKAIWENNAKDKKAMETICRDYVEQRAEGEIKPYPVPELTEVSVPRYE